MACVMCDIVGECLYACRSKGYGFVSFRTLEAAENGIAAMHGKPIGYRHVLNCTIPFCMKHRAMCRHCMFFHLLKVILSD